MHTNAPSIESLYQTLRSTPSPDVPPCAPRLPSRTFFRAFEAGRNYSFPPWHP